MNPYTTMTRARIQQRDIDACLDMNSYLAGASIAALERRRGWQAEAEVNQLMKEHGVTPRTAASLVSMMRQAIGKALVRAGERLSGVPESGAAPGMGSEAGTLQTSV